MEQNKSRLPEFITIGDQQFKVSDTPALVELIAAAQRVEKDKLYSTIEKAKREVQALSNAEVVATVDTDSIREVIKEVLNEYLSPITEKIGEIQRVSTQTMAESLEDYRQRLLKENYGKCIPELVKGNTKEEINESLRKSIEILSRHLKPHEDTTPVNDPLIVQQAQQQANGQTVHTAAPQVASVAQPVQQNVNQAVPEQVSPPSITVPRVPANEPQLSTDIKKLSLEEYAKRRESLLNELKMATQ